MVASCVPLTGDLACNPGLCPRLGIEAATLDSQANTQPLSHTARARRVLVEE